MQSIKHIKIMMYRDTSNNNKLILIIGRVVTTTTTNRQNNKEKCTLMDVFGASLLVSGLSEISTFIRAFGH